MSDATKRMISMMRSCFTYGGVDRNSWLFSQYIEQYRKVVPNFDEVFDTELKNLQDNFEIVYSVYTDTEGCTYNQLKEKVKQ